MYDVDEYIRLALHASGKRNLHACLRHLKQALRLVPDNPQALYLLAIQHAELGLLDRAIAGLTRALALEVGLETARLQLGLLLLDRGRGAEASEQFLALQASTDPSLRAVAVAMIEGLSGQLEAACERIRAGLNEKATNQALHPLMQAVLARFEKTTHASATLPSASAEPSANRLFMGAYGR